MHARAALTTSIRAQGDAVSVPGATIFVASVMTNATTTIYGLVLLEVGSTVPRVVTLPGVTITSDTRVANVTVVDNNRFTFYLTLVYSSTLFNQLFLGDASSYSAIELTNAAYKATTRAVVKSGSIYFGCWRGDRMTGACVCRVRVCYVCVRVCVCVYVCVCVFLVRLYSFVWTFQHTSV